MQFFVTEKYKAYKLIQFQDQVEKCYNWQIVYKRIPMTPLADKLKLQAQFDNEEVLLKVIYLFIIM